MNSKKILTIAGVVAIIGVMGITALLLRGDEDTWLCQDGEWTRHGDPTALPDGLCGSKKITGESPVVCQSFAPENCPNECVVCPPCPECSSISCQEEKFCAGIGISRDWYENIKNKINNFQECAAAGNAVMESYPRQCRAGEQNFTEDIGNELEKTDLIKVDSPRPNQAVESPLEIIGQARGNWFFEASFPVKLLNEDGSDLASGIAQAKGEWMTDNFVPFSASLEFTAPKGKTGLLILKKDNPSGLPENDDELRIPVSF